MAKYRHFAGLITGRRLELGFRTSRKFHASLDNAPVEYQSWIHVESGRRLPKPSTAIAMARCLKITPEEAILAYTRDIFGEDYESEGLKNLQDFARGMESSGEPGDHEGWHELNERQCAALEKDVRLYHLMALPFFRDRIHVRDLAELAHLTVAEVLELATHLQDLGLVQVKEEMVAKVYKGIRLPRGPIIPAQPGRTPRYHTDH